MSKFRYDTTVEIIKGGPGNEGKLLMKGVASDASKDSDGHNLNPSGFDTTYFLEKGFMNWNHEWKKNPMSIVGKPTKAFVNKDNQLEIEYSLFKGHKMAEEVYQLAEVLGKNNMHLGLSIEGHVLATDPKDSNKITKARITDCAITPHPKNSGTITSIIKGNNFQELVDFEKLGSFEVSPEGALIVKGMSTETAEDIIPESVEGQSKDKKKKKKEGDEDDEKKLTKGEVFERLSKMNKNITLEAADAIFNYTLKFQKSQEMKTIVEDTPEVSNEALTGALEKLGLVKGTETETVEDAAAEGEGEGQEQEEGAEAPATQIEKGAEPKAIADMTVEERAAHKMELQKGMDALAALEKGTPAEEIIPDVQGSSELVKAVTSAILKSEERQTKNFNEKAKAIGVLTNENAELIKGLTERLEELEDQPKGGRAVLTKGFQPKPGEELEKGGDGTEGMQVISLSQNKAQLCSTLTDIALEKAGGADKIDSRLRADLVALEAGSHVSDAVMTFAKAQNIQIVQ